ncbi:hypothetical protein TorRG33x02_173520 [Trema orientale]|uniref:Uncharacterized protein n=1 Tax=Trema orientale TaxID=63057 RepID=A0A2P5EMR8_TREOI|nr:hypothetical protein TorRG33x02_173520 [Trema orientale]
MINLVTVTGLGHAKPRGTAPSHAKIGTTLPLLFCASQMVLAVPPAVVLSLRNDPFY